VFVAPGVASSVSASVSAVDLGWIERIAAHDDWDDLQYNEQYRDHLMSTDR
jgi:hypothetical protein